MAPSPWPPGAWHEDAVRQAFDVLLDPFVLFTAMRDDTGRIVDFVYAEANRAACEYTLMSRDELVGSRLLDLLPGHRDSGVFAALVEVVETGRPLSLDAVATARPDQGERWFDLRAVKVGDGLSSTWRDVTGRISELQALREAQAEAARAREAEQATSLSMDAAVIGMAIVSPDLRFRRVNAAFARMLGYTPAQLATMTFTDITHPDDIPRGHDDVARLQRGEIESFHERKRYLTAWGQTLWVDLFVAAARNPDGTIHHHVAQVVDVTAEVVSAAALSRTVDTLEDLATHDPLRGWSTGASSRTGSTRCWGTRHAPGPAPRCCSPTSTGSSRSTTRSATPPATSCWPRWPPGSRPRSGPRTSSRGSAATSSSSCSCRCATKPTCAPWWRRSVTAWGPRYGCTQGSPASPTTGWWCRSR